MGKGEGRGEGKGGGKGGYMDIFQELEQGLQAAACCLCIMIVAGPICIIASLSYFGSSVTDSRSIAINNLKPVVDSWESGGRSAFVGKEFVFTPPGGYFSQAVVQSIRLRSDHGGDVIPDLGRVPTDTVKSSDWQRQKYTAQARVSTTLSGSWTLRQDTPRPRLGTATWSSPSITTCTTTDLDVTPCSSSCSSSSRRRRSGSSSCTTCSSKCRNEGGTMDGQGRCRVGVQLERVTTVIDPLKAIGSQTPHGFALVLPTGLTATGGQESISHQSFGTYKKVSSCPTSGQISIALEVRSAADPYLKAVELTDYTNPPDFGNTPGENVATGVTLLVLGIFFCTIPIGGCWLLNKQVGRRGRRTGVAGLSGGAVGMVSLEPGGMAPMVTQSPLAMAPTQGGIYEQQPQYGQQQPIQHQYQQPMPQQMPVASAVAIPQQQYQQPQPVMVATATAVPAPAAYAQPQIGGKAEASAPPCL
eukprot:COSAG05_NODE_138_length_16837_cov_344.961286_17_plen_473_part_00